MAAELLESLALFFERGGITLWVILVVSLWLWALLFQGYFYLYVTHPRSSRRAGQNGAAAVAQLVAHLHEKVSGIHALVPVLPLLGLLGTVIGMIRVFDVLAIFGSTNPRGLSSGISQALLTTLAGLATSLAGLYAGLPLSRRLARASRECFGEEAARSGFALTSLLSLRALLLERPLRQESSE